MPDIFGNVHLGYIVIETEKFADWRRFGRDAVGSCRRFRLAAPGSVARVRVESVATGADVPWAWLPLHRLQPWRAGARGSSKAQNSMNTTGSNCCATSRRPTSRDQARRSACRAR